MKPYDRLPDTVTYKDHIYPLDLSYAAFFAVSDAMQDERLMYHQKLEIALDTFVLEPHPDEAELLEEIYKLLKDKRPKVDGPTYMNIEQDWPYICAGFMQAYGIDLFTDKDIHILQFQAYLQGLPKSTKLMDIIGIRAAKVPEANKHNSEQIAELTRLKAIYAIQGTENDFKTGLGNIFEMLKARAKANEQRANNG